jgi:integrase
VRNVHAMLHRAFKDAVRLGYLVRNVADGVTPPRGASPELQVWTPQQLRAFLAHVRHDRLYALWLLVATTGMRPAELAGLRWVDVDLDAARLSPRRPRVVVNYLVHESEPKTRMGKRSLAPDPATLAALREHQARQEQDRAAVGSAWMDSGLVFTRPDGSPIHSDLITDWFRRLARAVGLPPIRLHDVRHSYATAAGRRRPGQGGQRAARSRHHRHHLGRVQPRHPRYGRGGRQRRGEPDPRRFQRSETARTEARAVYDK